MFAYIRNGIVVHISGSNSELMDNAQVVEIPLNTTVAFGYLYNGSIFSQPPTPLPQTIAKTHFLLTFTSAERVKARSLRATDAVLDDFWLILDTTDTINMALPSVQNGVEYTLTAVKAGGLTTLNVATRKAEILAGKLQ
jgi:hypothetical protein